MSMLEGFGCNATGGAGGQTIVVNRLDDPFPIEEGTLRWALQILDEPRIVTFSVAGVIALREPIRFVNPNCTINGSTAPGNGICVKGGLMITDNTIVRYLRVRQEEPMGDCIEVWGANNVIDHCSLSWAGDEAIGFHPRGRAHDCTVQWCIISENQKGLLASHGTYNISIHHNLFAHNYIRNPYVGSDPDEGDYLQVFDIRNNVTYDIGNSAVLLKGMANANVVGNYFLTKEGARLHRYCVLLDGKPPPETIKLYLDGNFGPRIERGEPEWNEVRYQDIAGYGVVDEAKHRVDSPFDVPSVSTEAAGAAYQVVLRNAGAVLPVRDSIDKRIVHEVETNTGICSVSSSPSDYRVFASEQWANLQYGVPEPEAVRIIVEGDLPAGTYIVMPQP